MEITRHSMTSLVEYINEVRVDKRLVIKWINDNYAADNFELSKTPKNGKYEVFGSNVYTNNPNLTSLTNDMFVWSEIDGVFNCSVCKSLKSLKGGPKKVSGSFVCYGCDSLIDLKYAPQEVGEDFDCGHCKSLKSLEGAPEKVGGDFYCNNCPELKSLEGAPNAK